ncbi:MAG: DUF3488 and transglutaminase-like domain-containing protein [Myxococcaceae bacterium]
MNARARRRLRLVLRDLAALAAFSSVGLSGGLPIWASAIFGVALVLSLIGFRPLSGRGVVAALLLLCFAFGLGFLVVRGGMDLVIAACSFATLVLAHRLVSEPMARTDHQVHLTSLLLLVGGAALTGEIWFAGCLSVFTVLAALSLGMLTIEGPEADQLPLKVRPLLGSLGTTVGFCMLGGIAFFALFPRLSWNIAARRALPGVGGTTGMSDRVRLGSGGNIKTSARVVLRATLQPDPGVEELDQYWPGRSFDSFDGREWSGTGIVRQPRQRVDLGRSRGKARLQTIDLLPGYDSRTLVALDRPLTFASAVLLNASGSARGTVVEVTDEEVHVNESANAYSYQAYSLSPEAPQESEELDQPDKYTRLPKIDPRVEQKAAEIVGGENDPLAAGHKLEAWLRNNFSYSLELGPESDDPLATFLFDRKEGHCEHFATALAVMLRSQHFAARVTAGFFGGERIADAYVLRAGDAHAWVQVFEPGTGWVLLDATPPSGRGARPNALLDWLSTNYERLQALWRRAVVDYSFQDQLQIAQNLVRPPRTATSSSSLSGPPKEAWLAAGMVAIAVYAAWRLTRGGARKKRHPATGFLGKIEGRLRDAGVAVQPEEPLEELVQRLENAQHPVAPAARAASKAYLGARFGGKPIDAAVQAELLRAIEPPRREVR